MFGGIEGSEIHMEVKSTRRAMTRYQRLITDVSAVQ